jgi:hypothetical protein
MDIGKKLEDRYSYTAQSPDHIRPSTIIPNVIRVQATRFVVDLCDPAEWAPHAMGRSNVITGRIVLRRDMPEDILLETLLHEVIHVIADTNGLAIRNDETVVSTLSVALMQFMQDNPGLVARMAASGRINAPCPAGDSDHSPEG